MIMCRFFRTFAASLVKNDTMYSINDITEYSVMLIRKFAQHFGLTDRQAANYIERYGAISLLYDNYGIMHTLSFEDNVESIAAYCHRKGGSLV